MRSGRNPFYLRAAEHVDSDAAFVSMFEAGVLDLLPGAESLWDRPLILRSAPGAGKTSLLRLFTPGALRETLKSNDQADLVQKLRKVGAISDAEPAILGVVIKLERGYKEIEEVGGPPAVRTRLFNALLDSRILLQTLRSALVFCDLRYPEDLDRIEVKVTESSTLSRETIQKLGGTRGLGIFRRAGELEAGVLDVVDSLDPTSFTDTPMHAELWSLDFLSSSLLLVDGRPLPRVVVMFDDAHYLTAEQRNSLLDSLLARSLKVGRWITERYQALTLPEIVDGSMRSWHRGREGRDYIELHMEAKETDSNFKKRVYNIAHRRSALAVDVLTTAQRFESFIQPGPNEAESMIPENSVTDIRERVLGLANGTARFRELIAELDGMHGTIYKRAVEWRALEVFIHRSLNRNQLTFDMEIPVGEYEQKRADARVSELFLAKEYDLPYYYGPDRLVQLATKNVEQFLRVSGALFEEVMVSASLNRGTRLSARRQDALVREVAKKALAAVPSQVRHGHDVFPFLNTIGDFGREVTYAPSASYAPGVTGIALYWADYEILVQKRQQEPYSRLFNTIESAVAEHLLTAIPKYQCKGDYFLVLYLNRLLCAAFELPLQRGGFREKSLDEVLRWLSPAAVGHSRG